MQLDTILRHYRDGDYPLHDPWTRRFHWDRGPDRALLPLDAATRARAARMLRRARHGCVFTHDQHLEAALARLSSLSLRYDTWVGGPVLDIYRTLSRHGLLHTVEAVRDGRLVGVLLGVMLPGVFVAETMYQEPGERDVSKACLCLTVEHYAARGFAFLDVQMPHAPDHPASRLGEIVVPFREFRERMRQALAGAAVAAARDGGV